jgi:hypothetical protein
MNERIKQLAEQAGYRPLPGFDFANGMEEVFIEKFAELIVKECMDIAYAYDAPKMSGPGMIVANRIEDHFGVEE